MPVSCHALAIACFLHPCLLASDPCRAFIVHIPAYNVNRNIALDKDSTRWRSDRTAAIIMSSINPFLDTLRLALSIPT
jgi:hypothetical protein